jgi:hypothetical protein
LLKRQLEYIRVLSTMKRLGFEIFARKLVRGGNDLKLPFLILLVAIAVPAVGGIFGAIVAYSDFRRTMKERIRGNRDNMIAWRRIR